MQTFEYLRPTSLREACAQLHKHPSARVLAGGTDLYAAMKRGIARPDCIISLGSLPELQGIGCESDGALRLGALTRLAAIAGDDTIACQWPVLAQAAVQVGSPQIRHVGTLGGNLLQKPRCWYYRHPDFHCQQRGGSGCPARAGRNRYHAILGAGACCAAHPSDLAPALLALDGEAEIASIEGTRRIALAALWAEPDHDPAGDPGRADPEALTGPAALARDEILVAVHVPVHLRGCHGVFLKVAERQATDFASVSLAAVLVAAAGAPSEVRLALGGVAPVPWRAREAEAAIHREGLCEKGIAASADAALAEARPLAENRYKVELARALIVRALRQLREVCETS